MMVSISILFIPITLGMLMLFSGIIMFSSNVLNQIFITEQRTTYDLLKTRK